MAFQLQFKPTSQEGTNAWHGKPGCRTGHTPKDKTDYYCFVK